MSLPLARNSTRLFGEFTGLQCEGTFSIFIGDSVKSGPPNLLCHCIAPYGSRTKDTPEYGCPLAISAVRRPFIEDLLHQFQNDTRFDKHGNEFSRTGYLPVFGR
jgi:hypothetical protein